MFIGLQKNRRTDRPVKDIFSFKKVSFIIIAIKALISNSQNVYADKEICPSL